jgi:Fibronectin type III-like domain
VQVYVGDIVSSVDRPKRELKAFAKVELAAGESTGVNFELRARDLSFFSSIHRRWVLEDGEFEISVGGSSRDLPLTATVTVHSAALCGPVTLASPVGEWLAHPACGPVLLRALRDMPGSALSADPTILDMVKSLPLDRLASTYAAASTDPLSTPSSGCWATVQPSTSSRRARHQRRTVKDSARYLGGIARQSNCKTRIIPNGRWRLWRRTDEPDSRAGEGRLAVIRR